MAKLKEGKGLGICYGILGVVLFSSKAVMVKMAYEYQVPTLDLLLFRMFFSVPFYILIVLWVSKNNTETTATRTDFLWIVLFGFLGYYLASYFDFLGLNYIKASLERIILFTYPTIVVLLSWLFFKKKISMVQVVAILITYAGILLTFFNELDFSGNEILLGVFLILLSALTYASYLVGSGWLIPKFGVLLFTSYAMIISTLCVLIHYALMGDWNLYSYPWQVYALGLAMAVFATLIPSFLVSKSIQILGASNFSILGSLGPISTIILAYVFLNERLTFWQFVGMAIVIYGITYLSLRTKKQAN
ncbi:permease [Croceivirga lutea]|uniref:DMT family transporter n=1 Tax=Croceivirga lutea TaxID=1775167 RepID=UPI001639FEE7|nr:DMT family transporter [Croceivirga lutea]GGG44408.1 permease [Croceivirga lutea]